MTELKNYLPKHDECYVEAAPEKEPFDLSGVSFQVDKYDLSAEAMFTGPSPNVPLTLSRLRLFITNKIQNIATMSNDSSACFTKFIPAIPKEFIQNVRIVLDSTVSSLFINGTKIDTNIKSVFVPLSIVEPGENVVTVTPSTDVNIQLKVPTSMKTEQLNPGQYRIYPVNLKTDRFSSSKIDVESNVVEKLEDYEVAATRFLLNSYNHFDWSRFQGTFRASYDYGVQDFRLNSWIWGSGIVIRALLARWRDTGNENLRDHAEMSGKKLLDLQDDDGGFVVRWDYPRDTESGIERWRAPNDSAFLASNGLIHLYRVTNNSEYLRASIEVGQWILENALADDGKLAVGQCDGNWDFSWLYVDAGFVIGLFRKLYEETGDPRWKSGGKRFFSWYVEHMFVEEDGLFIKTWRARGDNQYEKYARGQGWALDGMIDASILLNDRSAEAIAVKLADTLVEHQRGDGGWNYLLDEPSSGVENKGTPVIAYHLARLGEQMNESKYTAAALRAIRWCEANQQLQFEAGYGGISSWSREGNIVGDRQATTAFGYANAYYLLARNTLSKELL